MSSNGAGGKKWIVTKTVNVKGKPVCWCIPVDVKTGATIDVTFGKRNTFDLKSVYDKAMQVSCSGFVGKTGSLTASASDSPLQPRKPAADTPDATSPDEPLTVLKSGPDHARAVYRLKNSPASDVHRELQQLFHLEGGLHDSAATSAKTPSGSRVAIVPCVVENSLVISGAPGAVEEVQGLLEKLDRPAAMLQLDVEIGEVKAGEAKPAESSKSKEKSPQARDGSFRLLARPARMETTAHVRLVTLDNQPAFVHMGSRVPRITGASVSSSGGETRSTTLDNVGLIVGVTPRIASDGAVVMQIDVEQGQVAPEKEGVPIAVAGGNVVRSPRTDVTTVQATVRIPDAQAVVLSSVTQKGKDDKELVIVVTPHIIRPE
jgi:type II secretory pathway component GspD/PulD (secretin)